MCFVCLYFLTEGSTGARMKSSRQTSDAPEV